MAKKGKYEMTAPYRALHSVNVCIMRVCGRVFFFFHRAKVDTVYALYSDPHSKFNFYVIWQSIQNILTLFFPKL